MENNDIDTNKTNLDSILEKEKEINTEYEKKLSAYENAILLAEAEGRSTKEITDSIKELGEAKEKELKSHAKSKEIYTKREAMNKKAADLEKEIEDSIAEKKESEIREKEEGWDKKRQETQAALQDPSGWMKTFLMRKAAEKLEYITSAKRRREVADEKEKKAEAEKKQVDDLIKKEKSLHDIRQVSNSFDQISPESDLTPPDITPPATVSNTVENITPPATVSNTVENITPPDTVSNTVENITQENPTSILKDIESVQLPRIEDAIYGDLAPILKDIRDLSAAQLKTDKNQFKADNRISAAEEAAAAGSETGTGGVLTGGKGGKNKDVVEDGVGGIMSTIQDVITEGAGGMISERAMGGSSAGKPDKKPKTKAGGLKGILKNIMAKFGKAGKFLMSLGSRFLLPLITTPAGWAVLAGLAVGGLVFAYWDDIASFVGKMFDGVKSMFSKVVSKISGMFSAVGNAIKEVISFFNPMNLLPMIAKALLPADMYGAVSSFFGGDNAEEIESKDKKATLEKETAIGDKMEAELSSAKSDQLNLGKSLSSKNVIAAEKDGEVITIKVGQKFEGSTLRSASHANWKLKQAGYKVLSPEETNAIMDENEKDIKLKQFDLDVQVGREVKLIDDIAALDESIATGKKKNDKPGNVVADLVRAGTAEYNVWGDSTIKNWPALQKLDYETLEKVLAFDDWGDKTKKGILGIMNSKKQLIGANDIEPQDPNPITSTQQPKDLPQLTANKDNVLRKDKLIAETIEKGMDNKIDNRSTQNNKPPANQNIISSPVVNNNNTTIKQEKSYDTDITARGLNKSSTGFWDDF
jgi:hypothetical protein